MTKRENIQGAAAALLALAGVVLITVRPWGMRFSGFLLVGLAAVLALALLLDRWAAKSNKGRLCRRAFRTALVLVLVPLTVLEGYVIREGNTDRSAIPADAVIVLGAGVNGKVPSLSLYTRLTAALDYLEETGLETIRSHEQALARQFYEGVSAIPGVTVYGDFTTWDRAPVVSLNIRDYDSSQVSDVLAEQFSIATRPGAHCAPRLHRALGTMAQGAVRFSFGWFNTEEETQAAIAAVRSVAE